MEFEEFMASMKTKEKNKYKIETNKLESSINELYVLLVGFSPKFKELPNLAVSYRNAIFNVENTFSEFGYDFWDLKFDMKDIILKDFNDKLSLGTSLMTDVLSYISKSSTTVLNSKTLSNLFSGRFTSNIEEIKEINSYFENYSLDKDFAKSFISFIQKSKAMNTYSGFYESEYEKVSRVLSSMDMDSSLVESKDTIASLISNKENEVTEYEKTHKSSTDQMMEEFKNLPDDIDLFSLSDLELAEFLDKSNGENPRGR